MCSKPIVILLSVVVPIAAGVTALSSASAQAGNQTGDKAAKVRTLAQEKSQPPHSDTAKSVPHYLRAGVVFNEKAYNLDGNGSGGNDWYKIPAWLAGTFKSTEVTVTSFIDLKSGRKIGLQAPKRNESMAAWGVQKDKQGDIWQYVDLPNQNSAKTDEGIRYSVMVEQEPVESSDSYFTVRRWQRSTIVNASTQRVERTYQTESLVTFTPLGANQFRREESVKQFDENGEPVSLQLDWSIWRRTAEFHNIFVLQHKNMVALFREYLSNHHLSQLIPDN
jgi:hypothetical protein